MGDKPSLRVAFQSGSIEGQFEKAIMECPEEFKATFTKMVDEMAFHSYRHHRKESSTYTQLAKERVFSNFLQRELKDLLYKKQIEEDQRCDY